MDRQRSSDGSEIVAGVMSEREREREERERVKGVGGGVVGLKKS